MKRFDDVKLNTWYINAGKYPMMIFAEYNGHYIGVEFSTPDLWCIDYWSDPHLSPIDRSYTRGYDMKLPEIRRAAIDSIFKDGDKYL